MDNKKKILIGVIAVIVIATIAWTRSAISKEWKIRDNSVYCMEQIRIDHGEYLWGVSCTYGGKENKTYQYYGSFETEDNKVYNYKCDVIDENNVEVYYQEIIRGLETEEERIAACEEETKALIEYDNWEYTWNNEEEAWASFVRIWHVIYSKWWKKDEDDVECYIDMVDKSVNVSFSNHTYNWEIQEEVE